MIITTTKSKIRCDVIGCKNLASVFIFKNEKCFNGDAIKLCDECAKEISKVIKKHYANKGKSDVKEENV